MSVMKKGIALFLFAASMILAVVSCSKEADDEKNGIDLTVTTSAVTDVTAFSAKGGRSITGAQSITQRGICWSTSEEPTVNDEVIRDVDPVTGNFSLVVTDLEPSTTYYVRAFAVASTGETVYGST